MDKTAIYNISYGLYAISTWDNGRPTGCVANSVLQIDSEPMTVLVSLTNTHYTNEKIKETGRFSISIFGEESDTSAIGALGFYSGRDTDKFEKVSYQVRDMMPVLTDCVAYLTCEVMEITESPTHTLFLAKVVGAEKVKGGTPMTYAYYRKQIKGV